MKEDVLKCTSFKSTPGNHVSVL